MKEIHKRIITGVLGIILFLFCLSYHENTFYLLFLFISTFAVYEFLSMTNRHTHVKTSLAIILSAHVLLFLANSFLMLALPQNMALYILILTVLVLFTNEVFKSKGSFLNIGFSLIPLVYISIPFLLCNLLVFTGEQYDYWRVLSLLILIWTNDTMAYFVGKSFGKRKLYERISPKKTWEGFFGGLVFAAVAGFIMSLYLPYYNTLVWIILGVLVGSIGTLGDLIESMWKRSLNIKDSGNTLPGHGGFLDRFDSFIFVVPFVYIFNKVLEFFI